MTVEEINGILPIMILSGAVVLLLLVISFYRNARLAAIITGMVLVFAFLSLFMMPDPVRPGTGSLLEMDGYARFYTGLFIAASFMVMLLSYGYFRAKQDAHPEFYILLVLAAIGASILSASCHLVSLFLGLEILSVSLYVMISYLRGFAKSIEAGVKYLILAAASSAFLLFGIALFYAECGSLGFAEISQRLIINNMPPLTMAGFGLLMVGFGFKLAVVPFHMWTPDVYEGAPAPVTAFIATVSKGAMFSLLVRFFFVMNGYEYDRLLLLFSAIAVASMFAGNLLALGQNNVKRTLAYSSIAHLGYLLVAFIAGGSFAVEAVTFYLVAYFVTTLAAFGVVAELSGSRGDADSIDDYRGLFWQRPWTAAIFTAALLSLAGIPLTAGFLAKYYAAAAGIRSNLWILVLILIINSAISLYYYLRIVAAMFAASRDADADKDTPATLSLPGGVALFLLILLIAWMGIYPQTLIDIINAAMIII